MTDPIAPSPGLVASLPVVAWEHNDKGFIVKDPVPRTWSPEKWGPLVRLSDAQATIDTLRAEVARLGQERDAVRRDALSSFRHEHGQDFTDAAKWREWVEAQRMIEEDMPEGYAVTMRCSPGDWSLDFTDPDGEHISIEDFESTASFIRDAVAIAKEREAAAMAGTQAGERP